MVFTRSFRITRLLGRGPPLRQGKKIAAVAPRVKGRRAARRLKRALPVAGPLRLGRARRRKARPLRRLLAVPVALSWRAAAVSIGAAITAAVAER
jgi:hypothetical protein